MRPTHPAFTVLLGALAAIAPLSVDIGLPAFPALARDLHSTGGAAALTLSVFLVGFAGAQLVIGPLSDRIGRRPVLLGGLTLYSLAGVLCALAPSIATLIALRLIEGIGAASGPVMALAIVRDTFSGTAARIRFSYVALVISVAPIIAPTLGGAALLAGGWRGIYAVLAAAGAVLLIAVALVLPETRQRRGPGLSVFGGFALMLRTRRAISAACTNAFSFGALFAYISASPAVLIGALGASTLLFSALFAITSASIMLGAAVNGRLAARGVPARLPVALALLGALGSALILLVQFGIGTPSIAAIMPLLAAHSFCRGITAPGATHAALEPMGEAAGAASSVTGFLQMTVGALSSALVASLLPALGPSAMPAMMAVCATAALLAWQLGEAALPRRRPAPMRSE